MVWYGFVGMGGGGGQMTIEISIMDCNGLSWTIMGVGHDWDG